MGLDALSAEYLLFILADYVTPSSRIPWGSGQLGIMCK